MYDYDELKMAVRLSDMETKYRVELVDLIDSLKKTEENLPEIGDIILIDGDGSTFLVVAERKGHFLLYRYLSKDFYLLTRDELLVCYEQTHSKVDPKSILKEDT